MACIRMRFPVTCTTPSTCRTPTTAVSSGAFVQRTCATRAAMLIVRPVRGAVTGTAGSRTTAWLATATAAPALCGPSHHPCRHLDHPPIFSFCNYDSVATGVGISRIAFWRGHLTASKATTALGGRKSMPHVALPVIGASSCPFLGGSPARRRRIISRIGRRRRIGR